MADEQPVERTLPVYLPGPFQSGHAVAGRGWVGDTGRIEITLDDTDAGQILRRLLLEGDLLAIGFLYKPPEFKQSRHNKEDIRD